MNRLVLKNIGVDTQAELYEEVNKESINSFYDKGKIYEWGKSFCFLREKVRADHKAFTA